MTDTWAAKVLAGVPRYVLNMLAINMDKNPHGAWVKLPDVEAAIARMGAGDGLVEAGRSADTMRKMAEVLPMGSAIRIAAFAAADTITDLLAHIAALKAQVAAEEKVVEQVIDERDQAQEWADKLAHAIGGDAIGEHSNMNNPWQNALDIAEAAEAEAAALRAKVARLEGALTAIDALDPEGRIGDCSVNAISGLVLRMGGIARAALTDGGKDG